MKLNVLKKPLIYSILFLLAFIVAEPVTLYIHEYGHIREARRNGWNYTINYVNREALVTESLGIPYTAPNLVEIEDNVNATKEQLFDFWINPVAVSFAVPAIALFLTVFTPPNYKNRYVEVFIAFVALWLLSDALDNMFVFEKGADMWKIAHLFS